MKSILYFGTLSLFTVRISVVDPIFLLIVKTYKENFYIYVSDIVLDSLHLHITNVGKLWIKFSVYN